MLPFSKDTESRAAEESSRTHEESADIQGSTSFHLKRKKLAKPSPSQNRKVSQTSKNESSRQGPAGSAKEQSIAPETSSKQSHMAESTGSPNRSSTAIEPVPPTALPRRSPRSSKSSRKNTSFSGRKVQRATEVSPDKMNGVPSIAPVSAVKKPQPPKVSSVKRRRTSSSGAGAKPSPRKPPPQEDESTSTPLVLLAGFSALEQLNQLASPWFDQYEADVAKGCDVGVSAGYYMEQVDRARRDFWYAKLAGAQGCGGLAI
jgi:hypothetical protein